MNRPVYPVPFADARRGMDTMIGTNIQPLADLTMGCLCRAYWGGYFRASLALAMCGLHWQWIKVCVWVNPPHDDDDTQVGGR